MQALPSSRAGGGHFDMWACYNRVKMIAKSNAKQWLEYFRRPRHVGPLEGANAVGQAGGGCGDLVRIYLKIERNTVKEAAFLASGCPAAIAGAEACAELASGRSVLETARVGAADIARLLRDIPPDRERCLELSATAVALALEAHISSPRTRLAASNRVVAAMSGGVDSSTAAAKLHRDGSEVLGVTLRLHDFNAESPRACCRPADIDDARAVAAGAGFSHVVLDMRGEFKAEVIDRFCRAYLAGRTPNPCVDCNRHLRFTHLLNKARALGAAKVVTGHYVRIIGPGEDGRFEVRRARDRSKDQSYMFWAADQGILSRFLTPLGELSKSHVRELAGELGLAVAAKPESQDVCFVPDGDHAVFVRRVTGHVPVPGAIVDVDGREVGGHKGLVSYTVGQRKGLGVPAPEPLYVLRLDTGANRVVVGGRAELARERFEVTDTNFIGVNPAAGSVPVQVMTRYNSELRPAVVHPTGKDRATVELKESFGPIAPGQSAVFYDGDLVLGGGIID